MARPRSAREARAQRQARAARARRDGREIGRLLVVARGARTRASASCRTPARLIWSSSTDAHAGARAMPRGDRDAGTITAARTLLATGGAGQVFRETTNPSIATGDGIAMAADAGARVADLEFIQFHPTRDERRGRAAIPAVRGAARRRRAAWSIDAGERFMQRYEPAGDLASRDLVSRAIVREMERTHERRSTCRWRTWTARFVHERFPTIAQACANAGLDLAVDRIPVSPAAHYIMGGVETDLDGRTSVDGLFAAGEVACTGVHGANRLASNSLLEGLVFGARAADAMTEPLRAACLRASDVVSWTPDARRPPTSSSRAADDVRALMWRNCGLLRDGHGMEAALTRLEAWHGIVRTRARVARGRP